MTESSEFDFDFLIGAWNVKHHRLKKRLADCTEWEVADAKDEVRKILNGLGNIGCFTRAFDGDPYEGVPIRIFHPETRQWRIYWADTLGFRVEPPVIGRFENSVGTFIGDDEWEGRPVRVRFIWSDITENSARWEQAFSADKKNLGSELRYGIYTSCVITGKDLSMRFAGILFLGLTAWSCDASTQTTSGGEGELTWADVLGAEITDQYRGVEHRAFDFWIGEFEMNWRAPGEGAFEHEPEGSWTHQRVFPILGGKAIVELAWDRDKHDEPSQRGFSIRYFDAANDRWVMAQNWPNKNNNGGAFLDQLVGRDHLGRLTMYSASSRPQDDGTFTQEHRRYNFADIRPGVSFRWDGSNSGDNGATWHTWYVVDAHRRGDLDAYGQAGTAFPGVHNEVLCAEAPHGAYDTLQGVWQGTATDADGGVLPVRFSAGVLLDGCGVAAVLESDGGRTFMTFAHHPRLPYWVSYRLDDQPGTGHAYFVSENAGAGAVFEESPPANIQDELTPFVVKETFDTSAALRRTLWTAMNDNEIAFQDETRETPTGEWRLAVQYHLVRP